MSSFWRGLLAGVLVSGLVPAWVWASEPDELRRQAEAAFHRAVEERDPGQARVEFRKAADYYEKLSAGHASGQLYCNLATAYLGADDIGRAILNYRRAERLNPGDDRVQSGLRLALQRVESVPMPTSSWISLPVWTWVGGTLYLVGWSLLLIGWRYRGRKLILGSILVIVLGTGGLGSACWELTSDRLWPAGVVCSEGTVLREGNGPSFPAVRSQRLPPGCEFRVLQHTGSWQQIELCDGTVGWIPEQPEI
jgi:hypothetical protein